MLSFEESMNDEFIPKVGILLSNGKFESNNGMGHSKNATIICRNLGIDIPSDTNSDDFLIMSGVAMIATYDGFKKKQIKIAKDNPHYNLMLPIIKLYEAHGFKLIEGWKINPEFQANLDNALGLAQKVTIEETIIIGNCILGGKHV